jgi:hypothetical protein
MKWESDQPFTKMDNRLFTAESETLCRNQSGL